MALLQDVLIVDPSLYDLEKPVATIDDIRKWNRQRYEMEQLTAVVYENEADRSCVGYKDVTENDFWVRGHMPGFSLMPGVIMCEAAAQLASYFASKYQLMQGILGFAGMEDIRFRGKVVPGDRFVIQSSLLRSHRRLITCRFVCLVRDDVVCRGIIKGVGLDIEIPNSP